MTLKVWHKLALILVLAIGPIGVLGYLAVSYELDQLRTEQRRLAGLQYVKSLRGLIEQLQKHRTAYGAIALAESQSKDKLPPDIEAFKVRLPIIEGDIDTAIEGVDGLDEEYGARLQTTEKWQEIKEAWEDLRHLRTGDLNVSQYRSLLTELLGLVAQTADRSRLIFVRQEDRYYLNDTLAFKLLDQIEALSQAQTVATSSALRKSLTPADRALLLSLGGPIRMLRDGVDRNAQGVNLANETVGESIEGAVVANRIACDDFLLYIDVALLKPERVDAAPAGVLATAQRPIDTAFQLWDEEFEAAESLTEQAVGRARRYLNIALWSIAVGLLVGGGLVFLIARGMTRQVYAITETFDEVEQGNYTARARVRSGDELGRMARSLNRMLDNTVGLIQSREEKEEIQAAVLKLLDEVHGAAAGDLTREAEVGADLTGPIAESFNFMIRQQRQVISRVQSTTGQVGDSAAEIHSLTEQLAQSSDAQADEIGQATQAIDDMANSIQRVSDNAAVSAGVAQQALANARKGKLAVEKTTQGMTHIREQVRETARRIRRLGDGAQDVALVATLVNDVAEWSSVLSLNASLQASLAGEGGQRYAVIAEVAERLAGRSADASRKLSALTSIQQETTAVVNALEETTREVVDNSLVATQAGQSLVEIETVATRLAELIQNIATAAKEQAVDSDAVSRFMKDVSDVTQKTADGTRYAAVSASTLSRLAEQLRDSVSAFRLPPEESSVVSPSVMEFGGDPSHDATMMTSDGFAWSGADDERPTAMDEEPTHEGSDEDLVGSGVRK